VRPGCGKRWALRVLGISALIAGLGGCAEPARFGCAPGVATPMAVFTLYFGAAIAGRGNLAELEWQAFLDDTVSVNLPKGYTVLDANGAWMNPLTGKTGREATKVVVAAMPEVAESLAAIERVRGDYRTRFHQLSVGMTVERACGGFE
jgi:Protein of unknown function (DUF3574)